MLRSKIPRPAMALIDETIRRKSNRFIKKINITPYNMNYPQDEIFTVTISSKFILY